jgi:hypothetical protein
MAFDDAAVNEVFDNVVSYALETGRFDSVNQHEPVNAPGSGLLCSFWVQRIRPIPQGGMGMPSGVVVLNGRIYKDFRAEPKDYIDPAVTAATSDLIGAFAGNFSFGGAAGVRAIDILGMTGFMLEGVAGYLEIDRHMHRVMTLTVPVIVNDMWTLEAG